MTSVRALARACSIVAGAGIVACGGSVDPRAQWLVVMHTDAPVPLVGDRLLVEVLDVDGKSACSGCRRLLGVADASLWPVSFGIPDVAERTVRLRVRLFRSDHSDVGGAPIGGLPIDVLATLPPTGGGIRRVAVTLSTACAGVASDIERGLTCDPSTDTLAAKTLEDGDTAGAPTPGSFPAARTTPCTRAPRDGMICVDGGLFIRGGSDSFTNEVDTALRAGPERLVRLSPFALDRTEVTVAAMRAIVAKSSSVRPTPRSLVNTGCTYTEAPSENEALPVNCLEYDQAAAACAARGLRLPTEAEWEFAAKGRDRENRFPWGNDPDGCRHAVIARGRAIGENPFGDEATNCRKVPDGPPLPWGPRPVEEGDDVNVLGIRNLGGNVNEFVADAAGAYDGPCGAGPRILVDPRCDVVNPFIDLTRGGYWTAAPALARTYLRNSSRKKGTGPGTSSETGFRCAESL